MKTLILQLARFGDIYQTWPVVRALQRADENSDVHILVRERFADATVGLEDVTVHKMPNKDIFEPLLRSKASSNVSLERLTAWLIGLRAHNFDRIINLSFSPVSSYIVDLISTESTFVTGYSRTSDDCLNIVDDASSYFYAQVGIGRSNHIHVSDLFALVANTELIEDDFRGPNLVVQSPLQPPTPYIVVHAGASESHKRLSETQWSQIIGGILQKTDKNVVLVGANGEQFKDSTITSQPRVFELTGKTKLPELFGIIGKAEMLIGCDSVALQIATLTNTKTLSISFASVNFWETGPRAEGSRVIWYEDQEKVEAGDVVHEAVRLINNQSHGMPLFERTDAFGVLYQASGMTVNTWCWDLTRSIYTSSPKPSLQDPNVREGVQHIRELATLGMEQIKNVLNPQTQSLAITILNEVDTLVTQILSHCPALGPLVRWFQTEKSRVNPGSVEQIQKETDAVFRNLYQFCNDWLTEDLFTEKDKELTWKS